MDSETFTTIRVHTGKNGWKTSCDTKTIQKMENGDSKVIHHYSPKRFKAFYYRLHYLPIEGDFDTLEDALAWKP